MNTAECSYIPADGESLVMLQWSRRVNTAEWSTTPLRRATTRSLQWSRRVNTAECEQHARGQSQQTSFNGAAV